MDSSSDFRIEESELRRYNNNCPCGPGFCADGYREKGGIQLFTAQNPWVAEREATLCTWKFDYNRGYISNMSVSLINDFMCLSERQIKNYALMIKECGFTGIQVTDICAA